MKNKKRFISILKSKISLHDRLNQIYTGHLTHTEIYYLIKNRFIKKDHYLEFRVKEDIRKGLISANWFYFKKYDSFNSNLFWTD